MDYELPECALWPISWTMVIGATFKFVVIVSNLFQFASFSLYLAQRVLTLNSN